MAPRNLLKIRLSYILRDFIIKRRLTNLLYRLCDGVFIRKPKNNSVHAIRNNFAIAPNVFTYYNGQTVVQSLLYHKPPGFTKRRQDKYVVLPVIIGQARVFDPTGEFDVFRGYCTQLGFKLAVPNHCERAVGEFFERRHKVFEVFAMNKPSDVYEIAYF